MAFVCSFLFVLALFSWTCMARAAHCNVKDYGAKGDGKSNDTESFIIAVQACTAAGNPSTVYVPPGNYNVWPLVFEKTECTNLFFNVTGTLLAPSHPSYYKWVKNVSYLLFNDCENFTLHGWGTGTIDGQGQEWWDLYHKYTERPKLVIISGSKDVTVKYITLKNSPMFHLVPEGSENVLIEGLTISAPSDSPNTDGIDPGGSKGVVIRDCVIGTGDDNVAVKSGCQDVLVEDSIFLSGHGCSIGSINTTGVRDVVLRNIIFMGTENGARIKTWQGGSGVVENISYINLTMQDVGLPIKINMYYCSNGEHDCRNRTEGVIVTDILFSNISGTQTGGLAGQLYCSDTVPCTHITMRNINIKSGGPGKQRDDDGNVFKCWRAFGKADNVEPSSCLMPI